MEAVRGCALALMITAAGAATADDQATTITVHGTGQSQAHAVDDALSEALVEALGTQVFAIETSQGDHFESLRTSVSEGMVSDYEVVESRQVHDGWHVTAEVTVTSSPGDGDFLDEIKTWDQRAEQAGRIDYAQQRITEFDRLLRQFRSAPSQQLKQGYAFVLRSYELDSLTPDRVSAIVWVDVVLNESWWDAYYTLAEKLTPQTRRTTEEGPWLVEALPSRSSFREDSARLVKDPQRKIELDSSLSDALAREIPVEMELGGSTVRVVLDQNVVRLNYDHSAVEINADASDLSCGKTDEAFCGTRFTVGIPVDTGSEYELVQLMNDGLDVRLDYTHPSMHLTR